MQVMASIWCPNVNRLIVYLHFHVKNTTIDVVVRTVHNTCIHGSVGNPDSEVANKAGCLTEVQNLNKNTLR